MNTTPNRKPAIAHAQNTTAKLAAVANKAAKQGYSAAEDARSSAESAVRVGSDAMKDFLSTSTEEAQKAQEKVFSIGRESAENLAKSADVVTKALLDVVSGTRSNVQACMECGSASASLAKDLSAEAFEAANKAFSDHTELAKEALACRTINDVMELQSKAVRGAIDQFFSQSMRMSDMLFEYASEALEPINERIAETANKMGKNLSN